MQIYFAILFVLTPKITSGNSRHKRQLSIGFGLPSNQNIGAQGQDIGSVINGFLGGLFGQSSRPNQGQPVTINPVNIFNQFAGGLNLQSCNVNNGGCEQGCRMRGTRRQCYCNAGYILRNDRATCHDINECIIPGEQPCQEKCTNTEGSYQCSCTNGAVLLPDRKSCGPPTISCRVNNGGCLHKCNEVNGRVQCGCDNGFALSDDTRVCIDIDECASGNPCAVGEVCKNVVGSYECIADRTPTCNVNNGGCQQRCVESAQGPRCGCRRNFELSPDGRTCTKKSEPTQAVTCADNNGGCEQLCRERRGKVRCRCLNGFELRNDKKTCAETFGCTVDNGGCEYQCRTNKKGRVICSCPSGSSLHSDKRSCIANGPPVPAHPCSANNGGCDQICENNNGVPLCKCEQGYVLTNGICLAPIQTQAPIAPIVFPGFTRPSTPITTSKPPPTTGKPKACGVNTKKSTFRTRIVGGQPADPKDWPWMAALLRSVGKTQFCGGTLISERHVLTAAHCVYGLRSSDLYVRLGEYDFKQPDENNPTDFRVDEIRMHDSYNSQTQENDIAILKMGRSSSFSEFIWPACLPPPDKSFANERGYVTGWGTIDFGGPVSSLLLEVVLPVWNQQDCVKAYPQNVVASTMMCAGLRSGGKDSCQGDSGGPFLLQILPSSRWYVAGVVSWGKECAKAENPGVYTRVNKYLNWIDKNTAD